MLGRNKPDEHVLALTVTSLPSLAHFLMSNIFSWRECGLTGIRQPKRRILRIGGDGVFIAFLPVIVADCEIVSPKAFPTKAAFVIANPKSKLLDQLREVMRVKHYSLRTEEAYGQWVRRYLKFHREAAGAWRHPRDLGAAEVVAFLNHLANVESVAAGTQNQALSFCIRTGCTGFTG